MPIYKFDLTSLSSRTCCTPGSLIPNLFTLLKLSWQHQESDEGQLTFFHPQLTYFLFIIFDCWLTLLPEILFHGLSKHCFCMIPPTQASFLSLATLISVLKWGLHQSSFLGCLSFLHSLVTSFNFLIVISIFFVGIPPRTGNYLYPHRQCMYSSLLGNSNYILNLYFKSEKFKNHTLISILVFIPPEGLNFILPMNL